MNADKLKADYHANVKTQRARQKQAYGQYPSLVVGWCLLTFMGAMLLGSLVWAIRFQAYIDLALVTAMSLVTLGMMLRLRRQEKAWNKEVARIQQWRDANGY